MEKLNYKLETVKMIKNCMYSVIQIDVQMVKKKCYDMWSYRVN